MTGRALAAVYPDLPEDQVFVVRACARPGCGNEFPVPAGGSQRMFCRTAECIRERSRSAQQASRGKHGRRPQSRRAAVRLVDVRTCARPGCRNRFETSDPRYRYCRTKECDRERQRAASGAHRQRSAGRDPGMTAYQHIMNAALGSRSVMRDVPLAILGLTNRAYNSLSRAGVRAVDELSRYGDEDLLGIRNLGPGQLAEIRGALSRYCREYGPFPDADPVTAVTSWKSARGGQG